jgi:ribonuclease HI
MSVPAPHFFLVSQAVVRRDGHDELSGRWRFALQTPDGQSCLEAEDDEPETSSERLQLLAIVRGLEALDEPARVTVVAAGRSISRGLRYGVAQWRENDWQWERYGQLAPIKNGDLWQRIDRAMAIHQIDCRDAVSLSDDLATPRRSVSEGDSDLADVRIIRHRGRRLRIDRPSNVECRMSKVERRPKSSRLAALIGHWGLVIGHFATALRHVFTAR